MYDYLQLAETDNPAVIFRGIVGSHAYGTANAQSDVDMRGIFTVPSREYVRLASPPQQVSDERNDRTYYSLLRFCELMSEANPTTLEMLYLSISGRDHRQERRAHRALRGRETRDVAFDSTGEWTFDAIMEHAEKIQSEIESGKGRLRLVPDRERIDELMAEVMNVAGAHYRKSRTADALKRSTPPLAAETLPTH